jgi:RHS repeat-associated protein
MRIVDWARRPLALITLVSFICGLAPARVFAGSSAMAQQRAIVDSPAAADRNSAPDARAEGPGGSERVSERDIERAESITPDKVGVDHSKAREPQEALGASALATPLSLPTGGDKTGVSSQMISVPQGSGKIQGMGESFSMQLSTGVATFSVPFALPAARGGASPTLGLSYSSGGGHGLAGVGWDIGVPFIARQTDRGIPLYQDPAPGAGWTATQDRFVFNGGQELVPICLVGANCDSLALNGETMPAWASGWQYFRPRVEGSFLRFFWSPDHRTWRAQSKSGESLELGAPLDGSSSPGSTESDPSAPSRIFRWNLSRQYDVYGAANPSGSAPVKPVNVVVYRYTVDGANSYLTDIYDTPPAAGAANAPLTAYAHHTRIRYEPRPDVTTSYRRGWPEHQALRLVGVDVASKPSNGDAAAPRKLVRRYHLTYDGKYHASFLDSVQAEGRCGKGDESSEPIAEDASESFPSGTPCQRLPAMTFGYEHVTGTGLPGFEAFNEQVTTMSASPPNSVDEELTDLFDINSDGLPDVLVTAPAIYGGKHGIFLNGADGTTDSFGADTMGVSGVLGEDASTITLRNLNLSPGDLDGDGTIDLVHMPQVKTYSVYTPQHGNTGWMWVGRAIVTASAQSSKINLGKDGLDTQRMDVNGDGLVDVVLTTGTEVETFFALGKFAGGDGQFGHAEWTGATSAALSNDPVATCVPWAGLPVRFGDPDIKVGDMNGDGLPDIVRVHQGDVRYWPGRGNGVWGTGDAGNCPKGTFAQGSDLAMAISPQYSDPNGSDLRVDDVNGDGFDDLVQIRFQEVDVWLNVDGVSWTERHVITNTPAAPSFQHRVRLVDVNGSGTRDILWGDGNNYRYIDLSGGSRPGVLNHVANGLGKTTDLEYASSTTLMLAAERTVGLWELGKKTPWTSKAPMPIHVVTRVTDSDNLNLIGRKPGMYTTTYMYRDPVYDGRQREFRGFARTRATRLGDANSPTSSTDSTFLLGECVDEEPPSTGLPSACTFEGRWRDNRREALKGLPLTSESFDESGVYLSTIHHTYRLRHLYSGLDGREVRHAFESAIDIWNYDTASFDHQTSSATVAAVQLEKTPPPLEWSWAAHLPDLLSDLAKPADTNTNVTLRATAGRAHLRTVAQVDAVGNAVVAYDEGCVDGCPVVDGHEAKDSPIGHFLFPFAVPQDPSGWLWRNWYESTGGYGAFNEAYWRHFTEYIYDAQGNLRQWGPILYGTLALDRFHEDPTARVAPAPPEASSDGGRQGSYVQRDAFGNILFQKDAVYRCRSITYDDVYAQLAIEETVSVGAVTNGCGAVALTSRADYDRGFGAVVAVHDLHRELTTVEYDGFGRLTKLWKPDPVTVGQRSALRSVEIEYLLPTDPSMTSAHATPYSRVHTRTQDGEDPGVNSYREAWAYVDGFGRTLVTVDQADTSQEAGDQAPWIANGLTNYDAKGAAERAYLAWWFAGDPSAFPLNIAPTTPYGRQRYDAFGRQVQTFGLDGAVTLQSAYHGMSVDKWDAADLAPGPHQGTYASARQDGHGRAVAMTERIHVNGRIEARETRTVYTSTGEPTLISRVHVGSNDPPVVRWMRYDTLGRMVLNVEPNTSTGFTPIPTDLPTPVASTLKAWRYAYNDAGDLVGTSDARGCGANYHYDAGGRIIAEDYSPCTKAQAPYSPPDLTTGAGAEVFNQYDFADDEIKSNPALLIRTDVLLGRLVSVSDRASRTITQYDGRGRLTAIARQVARPQLGSIEAGLPYAPRWYAQTVTFDGADRPLTETTSAIDRGAAADVRTAVYTKYTKRGVVASVGSNYGDLVNRVTHDADGLAQQIEYGDIAKTTTAFSYDNRRRLGSVQTYRGPPPLWSQASSGITPAPSVGGAPSTLQLLLEDSDFAYDAVDNPTEIHDWRIADEWPAGAKPVTRKMQYDDLYRVTKIDYQYSGGDDAWVSPFDAEDQAVDPDQKRAAPTPRMSFSKRVQLQSFQYDWLGNTVQAGDDAHGFYDRSLGTITNGTPAAGPYQLQAATNESNTPGSPSREGRLTAAYDAAGYLTTLAVRRNGPCLPAGAVCSQRFAYDWDEVGRLARARRWDIADAITPPTTDPLATPAIDLQYAYDAADDRTIKTSLDAKAVAAFTLYPFDALELRRSAWDETAGDYERTMRTEVPYLFAHGVRLGRVAYAEEDPHSATSGATHVFLELMDHLGSTAIVIDRDTSELVERSTYQVYGSAESDYRPERWKSFREDYRFTGKEDDVEVGLQYFGRRYYAPALARWLSADPLTIHQLGADGNAYAYVRGRALSVVDPHGLEGADFRAEHKRLEHLSQSEQTKQRMITGAPGAVTYAAIACLNYPRTCAALVVLLTVGQASNHEEAGQEAAKLIVAEGAARVVAKVSKGVWSWGADALRNARANPVPVATPPRPATPPAPEPPLRAQPKTSLRAGTIPGGGGGTAEARGATSGTAPFRSGRTPLKEFDIDRYGAFNTPQRAGDGLEGHEILQNAWLEANVAGAKRGSGAISRDNPALALRPKLHTDVSTAQRALGLFDREKLEGMTAEENIRLNGIALQQAGVPQDVIQTATQEATNYANGLKK